MRSTTESSNMETRRMLWKGMRDGSGRDAALRGRRGISGASPALRGRWGIGCCPLSSRAIRTAHARRLVVGRWCKIFVECIGTVEDLRHELPEGWALEEVAAARERLAKLVRVALWLGRRALHHHHLAPPAWRRHRQRLEGDGVVLRANTRREHRRGC